MKRTPLRRKTPLRSTSATRDKRISTKPPKKRTSLRRVSEAQDARNKRYFALLTAVRAEQETCERCRRTLPWNSLDAHHPYGRQGKWMFSFILVCRSCHEAIHQHPNAAYEAGWLQPEYRAKKRHPDHPVPWQRLITDAKP